MGCRKSEIIQLGLPMGDGSAERAGGRTGGRNLPAPRRELGRGQRDGRYLLFFLLLLLSLHRPFSKGGPEHKAGARISKTKRMNPIFF